MSEWGERLAASEENRRGNQGKVSCRQAKRPCRRVIGHPRARLFSFEYAQLLTEGKDLEAEVVAGTEERAEAGEETNEKWNHGTGFIAQGSVRRPH